MLKFEDVDCNPAYYDSEQEAHDDFKRSRQTYNCTLFVTETIRRKDDAVDERDDARRAEQEMERVASARTAKRLARDERQRLERFRSQAPELLNAMANWLETIDGVGDQPTILREAAEEMKQMRRRIGDLEMEVEAENDY